MDAEGCCRSCGHPLTGAEAGATVSREAAEITLRGIYDRALAGKREEVSTRVATVRECIRLIGEVSYPHPYVNDRMMVELDDAVAHLNGYIERISKEVPHD